MKCNTVSATALFTFLNSVLLAPCGALYWFGCRGIVPWWVHLHSCVIMFCVMKGCGHMECRYSILWMNPWDMNCFVGQSVGKEIQKLDHNCCWNYKNNVDINWNCHCQRWNETIFVIIVAAFFPKNWDFARKTVLRCYAAPGVKTFLSGKTLGVRGVSWQWTHNTSDTVSYTPLYNMQQNDAHI